MGGAHNRRDFLTSITALGGMSPLVAAAEAPPRPACFVAVDDLRLDPAARADLERFAEPVLKEAAWLEELSLDDVDPAFVFVPRG